MRPFYIKKSYSIPEFLVRHWRRLTRDHGCGIAVLRKTSRIYDDITALSLAPRFSITRLDKIR